MLKEACPDVKHLQAWRCMAFYQKPSMSCRGVDELHVVEEASTYLSDAVKATGVILDPFQVPLPADGEIHPADILRSLGRKLPQHRDNENDIP